MTAVESGMPLRRAVEMFVGPKSSLMTGHLGKSNMELGLDHLRI